MSAISSLQSIAVSGITNFRRIADARAHNIANASTPGYKRLVAESSERPGGGVQTVFRRDERPGPLLPQGSTPAADGGPDEAGGFVEGSNVELVEEMVGLQTATRGVELMVNLLRREDEMVGSLLDLYA